MLATGSARATGRNAVAAILRRFGRRYSPARAVARFPPPAPAIPGFAPRTTCGRPTHYRRPMYLEHFGLREAPFAITPDPRFVFLSGRHREALAHLRYGIAQGGSGGFVLLTGDIGTGKTTLSRLLLGQLAAGTQPALLLNPRVSPRELLQSLCDELGIEIDAASRESDKALVDALNAHLLRAHARGGQVVAVVDEAQNLSTSALEQVRLLTNLETPTAKLLQVILLGQPELREVLARPDLAQLAQRITARYHLSPLDPGETESYLRHRLAVAGAKRFPFAASAVRALHARAGGVPRRINIIADRALTGAYALQANEVGVDLVQRAADEALGESSTRRKPWFALALGSVLVLGTLLLALGAPRSPSPPAALEVAGGTTPRAVSQPVVAEPIATAQVPGDIDALAVADVVARVPLLDDEAWVRLLATWRMPDSLAPQGCRAELAPSMHCLEGVGSLEKLRRLGAPVLTTVEIDGAPRRLLLVAVEDDVLSFAARDGVRQVARAAFEERWLGEFRALWSTPPELPDTLAFGAQGSIVDWVERALAAADAPLDATHVAGRYDAATVAAVRGVQRRFGLREDGIVGRETQWILASRLASAERQFAEEGRGPPVSPRPPLDSQP